LRLIDDLQFAIGDRAFQIPPQDAALFEPLAHSALERAEGGAARLLGAI
jgi:hypothetical protein